jgi:crotonobetainyl-CoA:carnitine CoA-transferase CaiB-like acyl-CoA transferase
MGMLDDIKILDFSHVYFGPYTTMILGDMGADIIKVEPPWGEVVRMYAPLYGGMSPVFLYFNRNKKGMTLNLKDPKALEIALTLAEKSDVVVENFKRGTMDKLGLGYEDVKKVRPDIIYASLSGFGLTGPYMPRPSFAPIASAMAGWYWLSGQGIDPEGPPIRPSDWHGDLDPGLWGVISILGAIRHRDRTGEGQLVDVSQLDSMIAQTGVAITRHTMKIDHPQPAADRPVIGLSTFGMFKSVDGWVYIASDPHMKPRLLQGMGVESLETTDERGGPGSCLRAGGPHLQPRPDARRPTGEGQGDNNLRGAPDGRNRQVTGVPREAGEVAREHPHTGSDAGTAQRGDTL